MKKLVVGIVLALCLLSCKPTPDAAQKANTLALDRNDLERIEEITETLANRLLDFSVVVRDQDRTRMDAFFADDVEAVLFPTETTTSKSTVKWVSDHGWNVSAERKVMPKGAFLDSLGEFLAYFSKVEDVRFKVKKATVGETEVTARVYFFIVGRNGQNHREWVRGWLDGKAPAVIDEEAVLLSQFALTEIKSRTSSKDMFSEVAEAAGIDTRFPAYGQQGNDDAFWHGAAAGDLNNDGLIDVYATGLEGNYLWLNKGNGQFEDVAEQTWSKTVPPSTGVLILDYDNDGDRDIYLASAVSQVLLMNRLMEDGKLEFRDVSLEAGLGGARALGFSALGADVDGNGYPDIYVTSYNRYGIIMPNSWHAATNGTPNLLFLNGGDGTFQEVAAQWGVDDRRWSYAAAFADLDEDGDQDLYVANDYGENGYFINNGTSFKDEAKERGVLDPGNGMGVSYGDMDNDGDLDLHVTNMSSTAGNRILGRLFDEVPEKDVLVKLAAGNSLYRNDGGGQFSQVPPDDAKFSAGWAWGGGFIDFDNDGWEDVYTPNGFVSGKSMKDT